MTRALVIGAGPAGLMAADVMSAAGLSVVVCDAMPSVGRKFLMAGKSGLNVTKELSPDRFFEGYTGENPIKPALTTWTPSEVKLFVQGLGQTVFTGSSGRVFPKSMKASPLLRAWLARLADQGVQIQTRHLWDGNLTAPDWSFETPEGVKQVKAPIVVLALGGSSWSRLGSTGVWANKLDQQGVSVTPFAPSNCGFCVDWSAHMDKIFGAPVKGCKLRVGSKSAEGEFVITQRGIEGGAVYEVSSDLRKGGSLVVDLLPDVSTNWIVQKLSRASPKDSLANKLRKHLKLSTVKRALVFEAGPPPREHAALAAFLKSLPLAVLNPFPLDEAISTAGGLGASALDHTLMLKNHPGVFAAGEMLDWDAPTGGYLLTGCFSSGQVAGQSAVDYAGGNAAL